MTEEARQRIDRLHRARRGVLLRNCLLVGTSMATLLMAMVLWSVLSRQDDAISVYVQEAQNTVREACKAAKGQVLSPDARQNCAAAERNELPSVLQSVVEGPPGAAGDKGAEGEKGEKGDKGDKGDKGEKGDKGDTGAPGTGVPGPQGPPGQDGQDGADGQNGIDGQNGQDGAPGAVGPTGPAGPSCPENYTLQDFHYFGIDGIDGTGDEQEWKICVRNT